MSASRPPPPPLRALAFVVAALILGLKALGDFLFERPVRWLARLFDRLRPIQRLFAWIGRQPPYLALAAVVASCFVMSPFAVLEVYCAAHGLEWVAVALFIATKFIGPLIVGKTWHAARGQALRIAWVAWGAGRIETLLGWARAVFQRGTAWLTQSPAWQAVRARVAALSQGIAGAVRATRAVLRRWFARP